MHASMTSPEVDSEKLLRTFLEMVRIDSPSGEEDAMREYLIGRMDGMGLSHRTDAGGNLIVDIPGHDCAHGQILVLSGHMDVVPPCHNIQPVVADVDGDRLITSDNTTVLGADDKAGLAPILESVFFAIEHNLPRPALRLIFTTREETKLGGAKDLDDESLQAGFAITLDHTGKQGVIINQAPTYIEFEVECRGKSVHAGIMPEQGVNAIVFACNVIEKLNLGRIDELTTGNVGFLTGGKATNIVPDLVTFRGELRSHKPEVLARELAHIEQTLSEVSANMPGTAYAFNHTVEFEMYKISEDHPGVKLVAAAARQTGLEPRTILTNGGSDNNIFVKRGLPGIVLSAGYMEPHSLKERVKLSEMQLCCRFLLNILNTFAQETFAS
ncbi:MAG TPA: M20/M25/M40 family metallo-hydrolase [Coleofasciculaceae cyanobacterium]|jgi:tripeptide aminopeptidase